MSENLEVIYSHRSRKKIKVVVQIGSDKKSVELTENAKPEFQKSLDELIPVFLAITGMPASYAVNLRITGATFGEVGDVDTIALEFQKHLDGAAKVWTSKLPPRMLDKSTTPGTVGDALTPEHADLCREFRTQSRDYFVGDRAQGLLPGIGGNADDDDEKEGGGEGPDDKQGELPGTPPKTEKKKRGAKKKAGSVEKFPGTPGHP